MHNGPLSKHRTQIWNSNQHPYKHTLNEFSYVNPALPGVTNLQSTIDWMIAVFYPNTKAAVATTAALPAAGNAINDYRVVLDDGDGKAASYRWQQLEGEASPSWHKVYDMDWGQDSILTNFLNVTQDLYVYKNGKTDIDGAGLPITGIYAGQTQYGGNTANQNLTLKANSGDGVGPRTGFVQTDDNFRPTLDAALNIGTITEKFLNLYLAGFARINTMNLQSGQITDATGTISFDNENLITTGDVTGDSATFTDAQIGSLNLINNTLTSDTNIISMLSQTVRDLANLITTQLTVGNGSDTLTLTTDAVRSLYNSSAGLHNFNNQNISGVNNLVATYVQGTTAQFGNFQFSGNTITNTNPSTFATPLLSVTDISGVNADFTTLQAVTFGDLGNYTFGLTDASSIAANSDFNLNANGTGKIVTKKDVVPFTDNNLDLGSATNRYNDLFLGATISNGTLSIAMQTLLSFRDALVAATTGDSLFYDSVTQKWLASNPDTEIDHDTLNNLATGDAGHTQFAMLSGRVGGQNIAGGTAAAEDLVLESTSNAAKGLVKFKDGFAPFATGLPVGTPTLRVGDVFASGENKGLRHESTATANNFNAASVGRPYFNTTAAQAYTDAGSFSKYAVHTDAVTDAVTTGSSAVVPFNLASVVNLTNSSLVSIANINIQSDIQGNRIKFLVNKTTVPVAILNNANISTGTGANFTLGVDYGAVFFYNGTSWNMVSGGAASGSGGGVLNLITNGSADDAPASIFTPYLNTAQNRPVTGSGGSPTVTTSLTAVNPLSGTKSFLLTKPATNCQGQGWTVLNQTLPFANRAKSLKIGVEYVVNSGTFVAGNNSNTPLDGDVIWYLRDNTNNKLVEPSNIKMFASSTTVSDLFEAEVQFDFDCLNFSLIAHAASTSALAYELKVDSVTVSPQNYAYGTPVTEEVQFTPTFTGFGTVSGVECFINVIGGKAFIRGKFTSGTTTAVEARISIPYTINPAYVLSLTEVGKGNEALSSATRFGGITLLAEPSAQYLTVGLEASSVSGVTKTNGNDHPNGAVYMFNAVVPILGGRATARMSDSYDGRQIGFIGSGLVTTQGLVAAVTQISFNTVKDNTGMWSTNQAVIKSAGDYEVKMFIYTTAGVAAILPYVNGVVVPKYLMAVTSTGTSGTIILNDLKAGDVVSFRSNGNITIQADANNYISIYKLSGSQAIAASEPINCRYTNTAGTLIANSGDVVVPFATKDFDTHGSFVVNTFTSKTAAKFRVTANIVFTTAAYAAGNRIVAAVYKNGAFHSYGYHNTIVAATTSEQGSFISSVVEMNADDTIQVRVSNLRTAGATSLNTTASTNTLSIEKVG